MTSNVNNRAIAHAAYQDGGQPLCKSRRAHFSVSLDRFRTDWANCQCKRCAGKLRKMDERAAAKLNLIGEEA